MSNIVLHGIDDRLDKLLEDTHYQLIYQEQVMVICMQLAGYSLGEADKIRKTIGRKIQSELDKEIPKLKQGFLDNGMKEESADTLCQAIQVCGSYSFNKCLSGSMHLMDEYGRPHKFNVCDMYFAIKNDKIKDYFPDGNIYSLSVDKDNNVRKSRVKSIEYSGIREVYQISTDNGREIMCTDNHKLPVLSNGKLVKKRLDEITITDKLMICVRRDDYIYSTDSKEPYIVYYENIECIEDVFETYTYSVEMEDEPHNYVLSNGIVSYNSHAVEYGLISYQTAYLKANYPLQYMCSLLNGNIDSEDDVIKYINECKRMGIKILPPSIKAGNMRFAIEGDSIRVGLAYLKGINNLEYTYYNSITMFFMHNALNKRIKEALIKSGAMDCFGISRNELFAVAFDVQSEINKEEEKILTNQSKIKAKEYELSTSKQGTKKVATLKKQIENLHKAIDKSKAHITELQNTYTNDYDDIQGEIDILGFTFKDKYAEYNTDYLTYSPDNMTNQIIIGEVIEFKKHIDKNGNQMAFVRVVPYNSYQYDFVMFARDYKELTNGIYVFKINRGNIIVDVAKPQKNKAD